MAEYIDREALLNKIWMGNSDSIVLRSYAAEMVNVIPSADVVEVKHGKWIEYPHFNFEGSYSGANYKCSNCHFDDIYDLEDMNYCPNCGAKMDGKE